VAGAMIEAHQTTSHMREHCWWQEGIIYEIYVRSFQDSNGDGVGDLHGILDRLDYLQWLGITAIWLTPVNPSPMKDFGYDIVDYQGIDPLFGTMQDFDALLEEVHTRNMKLIVDLVPNHTSDQHPWFGESRSSKHNPKRDWYIWKDAKGDGSPPNNWLSVLGGSAWERDEKTQQFYYHAFLKEQPDLNLKNPDVLKAIFDLMRFWLNKGVDGFRIDVMWHLAKDEWFRDNPPNPDYTPAMPDCDRLLQVYSCDQPEVHEIICKMRTLMDEYDERVMLGELYLPVEKIVAYAGPHGDGAQLPGNFQLLFVAWNAKDIAVTIEKYEAALPLGAWPNWVIGNHDRPRLISRIGADQARIAALMLLSLRGTPLMYYGDEIGMRQVKIPEDAMQDPQGLHMPGKHLSRDPQRTPMQWQGSKNAGFTQGKPWLRLDENFEKQNVQWQRADPHSLLSLYRRLIAFRQQEPSLMTGSYAAVHADEHILAFIREAVGSHRFLVILNLTNEACLFQPGNILLKGTIVLASSLKLENTSVNETILIEGNEGVIVRLA
jgi:alpha-glucosidase